MKMWICAVGHCLVNLLARGSSQSRGSAPSTEAPTKEHAGEAWKGSTTSLTIAADAVRHWLFGRAVTGAPKTWGGGWLTQLLYGGRHPLPRFAPIRTNRMVMMASLMTLMINCLPVRAEPVFEVEGVVSREMYDDEGNLLPEPDNEVPSDVLFRAAVSNRSWYIVTTFGPNYWIEYGSDGIDVFTVVYHPQARNGAGIVARRGSLAHLDAWAQAVWFAYASGCKFGEHDAELSAPWAPADSEPCAHIYRIEGSLTNETYRIPVAVRFVVDQSRVRRAAQHPDLVRSLVWRNSLALLDKVVVGQVGGAYQAEDWRPVGDVWLPARFVLEKYSLAFHGETQERPGDRPRMRISGRAVGFRERVSHAGPPIIRGHMRVADYRLYDPQGEVDYIGYIITNGLWPSADDARLRAILEEKKASMSGVMGNSERVARHDLVRLVIMVGMIITLCMAWVSFKRCRL